MNVQISPDEASEFAANLATPEYAADERDYKVAVHEVISRLLAPSQLDSPEFLDRLEAFFERRLDLTQLGLEPTRLTWLEGVASASHGVTNAFINLAGGRFGVNNFIWIPRAIRGGLGEDIRHSFQTLMNDTQSLAARVDSFRDELYAVEQRTQAAGEFESNWRLVSISLAFVGALLGAYDPVKYTFYAATPLRQSYEELVGPWPAGSAGERYEVVCEFVQSVRDELVRLGVPARDMIDAQSFLWLRRTDPDGDGDQRHAWTVRAGQVGQNEEFALSNDVVVIGWKELGDLSAVESNDDLRPLYESIYPDQSSASVGQQVGIILRFLRDIQVGDLAVLPLKTRPGHVAVGRVEGGYEFRPDAPEDAHNTRRVTWLAKSVPYDAFDQDLQKAFGSQGTVRQIHPENSYERILAAVERTATTTDALHLVVKWSSELGGTTVEQHIAIAEQHGSVWWGLATRGSSERRFSEEALNRLREQIAAGTETHVFLSGQRCWRTDLQAIAYSREEIDEALVPEYYAQHATRRYHLWVELANFEETDRDQLLRELDPDRPTSRGRQVALGNQTNPLLVRLRLEPRVWWVNQGSSFVRAREGGYLWAPSQTRTGGTPFDHWRNMRYLRPGDFVLNYANTQIRAVSRVTAEATASPRPDPDADEAWSNDGLRAEVVYEDVTPPVGLSEIPTEWRTKEGGPFTSDGGVKQGYLFPVSDDFASKLAAQYPQLGLEAQTPIQDQPPEKQMTLEQISDAIRAEGLEIDDDTLRRYHLSLNTRRGFVILAGVSGTGKTWLAEAYARALDGQLLVVPVAPNWTTNEDLLGYRNPINDEYYDTDFSHFLRAAAEAYEQHGAAASRYHLVLDEMNLARVEYYFAKFLSAMEQRARSDNARIELAPDDTVRLPSNLYVTGTINVDETTHAFSDKVYDRAQLIELPVLRSELERQLEGRAYSEVVLSVWDEFHVVAPFAYRVVDEITEYVADAEAAGVSWEVALDEQLLQKVLPKIKGTDLRVRGALEHFIQLAADRFPLSTSKAEVMLAAFTEYGYASYF